MAELTLVEAVNLALHHEMQQDPKQESKSLAYKPWQEQVDIALEVTAATLE